MIGNQQPNTTNTGAADTEHRRSRQPRTKNQEPRTRAKRAQRTLFINRSYYPDVEATGQLLTELCEDLSSDVDVTVICGRPVKVTDDTPAPTGVNIYNGVTIRRVWHTQFPKTSFVGRIINMLSFTVMATWSAFTAPRPDTVITETDPPFLCLLGFALKKIRRVRLVCYLQDIYPDIAVALGKLPEGWISGLLRRAFFGVYRRADQVVVLSRDMQDLMIERGVDPTKVAVIPNWVDTDLIYPVKENNAFRHRHDLEDKFVVMYSGNMGLSQNLMQILDVAELLQHRDDIVFAFVGDGADRANLERSATQRDLQNVRFFDYQPKSELAISLSAADLHLVVLRPEIQQLLMPSKIYGVLASGTPALVIGDSHSDLAEMVVGNKLGHAISGYDTSSVADYVATVSADTCRERIRNFASGNCDRETSHQLFLSVLGDFSEPAKSPQPCHTGAT